ncbi:MAG TPA: nucleotidyltransferase domain-containing protein [Nitrospinota bacterium]|nr:nucleotidyltransferase domain-containing protein [Nitrospinota bacterium]
MKKMENKNLIILKELVINSLKDEKVKIILFGSRSRRDDYPASDVDIGIIPSGQIDKRSITILREKIERLNIPYKVDIVNFSEVSPDFKREALKDAVVWRN